MKTDQTIRRREERKKKNKEIKRFPNKRKKKEIYRNREKDLETTKYIENLKYGN